MRLVQFLLNGVSQFGAQLKDGERIYNLSHIANSTIEYLRISDQNPSVLEQVKSEVNAAENGSPIDASRIVKNSSIDKLLSPVTGSDKLICSGMNYKDHCLEQNAPIPKEPIIFNKWPSCIVGELAFNFLKRTF